MKLWNVAKETLIENKADIKLGMGIGFGIAAPILASIATVKAIRHVDKLNAERETPLTKKEVVKECVKFYIYPVITSVAGVVSIVSGARDKNTAIGDAMSLYTFGAKQLDNVNKAVEQISDPEVKEKVKEAATKAVIPENTDNAILTTHGNDLFISSFDGCVFRSSVAYITKAIEDLTVRYEHDGEVLSLTDINERFDILHGSYGYRDTFVSDHVKWSIKESGHLYMEIKPFIDDVTKDTIYVIDFDHNAAPLVNNKFYGGYWD